MKIFKKGDIVYWQDLKGVVIDDNNDKDYPIEVDFKSDSDYIYFTSDGRYFEYLPPVLSQTPYTLNGFTQNKEIEKDTLVWVKGYENDVWGMRYYSHFEDGKHYCFNEQMTSEETDRNADWLIVETENPLLKK
jgi:hypothetical protein